ncbi:MAG: membrane dipeptidase [Chloroflexi bacterium]|nr:membrane dipeptidase [Chloroflexota bacterium]
MDFAARAQAIHQRAMVVDAHLDFALCVHKARLEGTYDSLRSQWLPWFREGGLKIQSVPIAVDSTYLPEMALRRTIQILDSMYTEIEENAGQIEVMLTGADIDRINGAGRIAALLALEGAEALGQDLSALRMLYKLGIRMISFTWMRRTSFGDGTWEGGTGGGLTRLGVAAVKEMNRLGMVVDVAHTSDPTFWSIMDVTSQPPVASHASCRALKDHPRNLTDDMIRALAAKGGGIGITAVPAFIADPATLAAYVDHVEHAVKVGGVDHVGIGTDFMKMTSQMRAYQSVAGETPGPHGPRPAPFEDLNSPEHLPNVTAELLRRGWSEADVEKVIGGNFARVFRQVL